MISEPKTILIAVDDAGLGGTSRSAIRIGNAWRSAGHEVKFYNASGFHLSRVSEAESIGKVITVPTVEALSAIALVHLHHKAPSARELAWVRDLLSKLSAAEQVILTHNIFGRSIRRRIDWQGPWIEGAIGTWVRAQIICSCSDFWGARSGTVEVVANPQSVPPEPTSKAARLESRFRLGLQDDQVVVLRVGSPIDDKWSNDYINLARRLGSVGGRLVVVGAPRALARELQQKFDAQSVTVVDQIEDNAVLQDYYRAADVLALSARRGESFGNVILEAILAGTPVVYKKAPFRDNTPIEFSRFNLFTYVAGRSDWVEASLHRARSRVHQFDINQSWEEIREQYSVEAVGSHLDSILRGRSLSSPSYRLSVVNWLEVSVLHNPIVVRLKNHLVR